LLRRRSDILAQIAIAAFADIAEPLEFCFGDAADKSRLTDFLERWSSSTKNFREHPTFHRA